MKTTIKLEDIFNVRDYNKVLFKIQFRLKIYALFNKLSFGVFENRLLKMHEHKSQLEINKFFKK